MTLIDLLAERGTATRLRAGAILFHEGDRASAVYGVHGELDGRLIA